MDWARAIERNSDALKAIVAALFAMLGPVAERVPRPLRRAVLGLLRPAEAAARRLVVIAARGIVAKPTPSPPLPQALNRRGARRRLAFQLFDPRKRFAARRPVGGTLAQPRIRVIGFDPRVTALWEQPQPDAPPPGDGLVDASPLVRRLETLKSALEDLPRQARRFVRLTARRRKSPRLRFQSPLRPGHPPGHRKTPVHDVDHVLAECHGLARDALEPNTS